MPDIVPSWMWRPPGEIIEDLIAHSDRRAQRLEAKACDVSRETKCGAVRRDRYYTQARRLRVRELMRRML